jgi:hypothetical protein
LPRPDGAPALVDKLATALVAAVDPGRTGTPADLAVLVEDLELANRDQPELVARHVREAVQRELERRWASLARRDVSAERVRNRCSFHLFVPMVEAYFFGDANALSNAGATRSALFDPIAADVEDFSTTDPDFLLPPDGDTYWAKPHRERHPKHYLEFLCDPTGTTNRYRERDGGKRALESLDWNLVLAPPEHAEFARALLLDLGSALGVPLAIAGRPSPVTGETGTILRNL